MIRFRLFALLAVAIFSTPAISQIKPLNKIAERLHENMIQAGSVDILVILRDKADLSAAKYFNSKSEKGIFVYNELLKTARLSQQNIVKWAGNHGLKYKSYFLVNAVWLNCPSDLVYELAEMPEVEKIIANSNMTFHKPVEEYKITSREVTSIEWGIDMINANDVWALGYTGEGVVIGGQDTGYDWQHPALKNNYRGWDGTQADHNYNWHDAIHELSPLNGDTTANPANNPCGLDVNAPCDDQQHGTHTMGTMIGHTDGDTIGVAPGSKWIGVRNMERGWGKPSTYIEGFEWFIAPTDTNNLNPNPDLSPDVINNSWGCPPQEGCDNSNFSVMQTVVENVKSAGIVVVVSAGNSGSGCESVDDPAAMYEPSFSIGAMRQNDTIANFSSRGPVSIDGSNRLKPNVCAPGVNVRSSIPNGGYANFSGTSMAGPHVAGAVALLISAAPELRGEVELIESILEETAIPKFSDQECGGIAGNALPNNTYGFGRIDILAAVEKAQLTSFTKEKVLVGQLLAFPNPAKDKLYLKTAELTGRVDIMISNIEGKVLYQETLNSGGQSIFTINIDFQATGILVCKLVNQKQQFVTKFVKK